SGLNFIHARMIQTCLEPIQDGLLLIETSADDEWKAKLFEVCLVTRLKALDFCRRKLIQAGTRLFRSGRRRQCAGQGGPSDQIRMSLNQSELLFATGSLHDIAKRRMKVREVRKGALGPYCFSDPW